MSVADELLANNARYAQAFTGPLPLPPSLHLAVVACMDARLNVYAILDLREGEAHVVRNASPFIPHTDSVRGFVFDVATGKLAEVN
jgi:carbonic anhydrase